MPDPAARPRRIALTSDDVVWYTDFARGYLGRFDPRTGAVKEWLSPSGASSQPYGIATEKDIVWYSESAVTPNTLVRFDPKTEAFQSWVDSFWRRRGAQHDGHHGRQPRAGVQRRQSRGPCRDQVRARRGEPRSTRSAGDDAPHGGGRMRTGLGLVCAVSMSFVVLGQSPSPLQRLLQAELSRIPAKAGIYVKHLKTGEEAAVLPDERFNSASVIKIPVFVMGYQMAEKGTLDFNARVTIAKADKRGGSGVLRYHDVGTAADHPRRDDADDHHERQHRHRHRDCPGWRRRRRQPVAPGERLCAGAETEHHDPRGVPQPLRARGPGRGVAERRGRLRSGFR